MKTSTSPLDKKLETLLDAIPPTVLKYFFLFSFVAGVIVSIFIIAGLVLEIRTGHFWSLKFLSVLSVLVFLGFVMWGTREMFRAFKDAQRTHPSPVPNREP